MTGKGCRYRLLILVIAAFAATGCSSPLGIIGNTVPQTMTPSVVSIRAERQYTGTYAEGDLFKGTSEHIQVYATYSDGRQEPLSLSLCTFYVIEDEITREKKLVGADGYPLTKVGPNTIRVEYGNGSLNYEYVITVVQRSTGGNQGQTGAGVGVTLW